LPVGVSSYITAKDFTTFHYKEDIPLLYQILGKYIIQKGNKQSTILTEIQQQHSHDVNIRNRGKLVTVCISIWYVSNR
jgi:hypothetical protein